MSSRLKASLLGLSLALIACVTPAAAQDGATWEVRKSSGDVWVSTSGVQPVSLTQQAALKPGDNIRTGRNGRVLLVRGEETILIAPNSVVGIPLEKKDGLSTTIVQQAGSILLEVEERNVKHFEVETPYLAAVVKGTHFRVTVGQSGSNVEVLRGKVEVADFKSGQFALVLPGQVARVSSQGNGGLSLSGSGTFSPIQQGAPRASSVPLVPVPRAGLSAPAKPADGLRVDKLQGPARAALASQGRAHTPSGAVRTGQALRITSTIGEVKLDYGKATSGLARAATAAYAGSSRAEKTVWNSNALTPGNGVSNSYNQGNGSGNGAASSSANGNGSASGNGNGNGNGLALGQGNGNAFGQAVAQAARNNGKGKGKN